MPIKIRHVERIPVHRRPSVIAKEKSARSNQVVNHASGMIKNEPVSRLENIIFNMLDKYTPVLNNYPKINRHVIRLSEVILKKLHQSNSQVL